MPCGRCPSCLRNRQNEWVFRLNEELRISPYSYFITLTYRDEDLPYFLCNLELHSEIPTLSKRDVQLFLKRLRKNLKTTIKYHIVGEYGPETLRPHYHGLIFSQSEISQNDLLNAWQHQDLQYKVFEPCYGRSAAGYVTKYICQVPFLPDHLKLLPRLYKPFSISSHGLGLTYLECNKSIVDKKLSQLEDFVVLDGKKLPMPRYYRNKLFPSVHNTSLTRVFLPDIQTKCEIVKQKRYELQYNIEEKRYKNYLFKHNLQDTEESRLKYEDYKEVLRKDSWRKAYKNSKYNLSKSKL